MYSFVYIHLCVRIHTYIYIYVCVCVCMYVCVCVCVCVCARMHEYTPVWQGMCPRGMYAHAHGYLKLLINCSTIIRGHGSCLGQELHTEVQKSCNGAVIVER